MATTTVFGWPIPADTDYVYQGYAAIDNVANGIDTTLYNISGSTGAGDVPKLGLTLITAASIGTAVSSVTVSNVFSSKYDNYKIVVSGGVASIAFNMNLTLGSATTGYYGSILLVPYNGGATSVLSDNNQSSFRYIGYGMANAITGAFELCNPFLSKNTTIQAIRTAPNIGSESGAYGGFLNDTNSYTSFTIGTQSAATMTGGTIRVYGYRNS